MCAVYHGKNGVVYMAASGTAPSPLMCTTEFTINAAADTDDVTCMGSTNKRYVMGIPDFTVELSGIWDDTNDNLWDLAHGACANVAFYLYPSSCVTTKYWYGYGWVSFNDISVPVDGAIRVTGSLSAAGDITQI